MRRVGASYTPGVQQRQHARQSACDVVQRVLSDMRGGQQGDACAAAWDPHRQQGRQAATHVRLRAVLHLSRWAAAVAADV
jgi:hypothetical protein